MSSSSNVKEDSAFMEELNRKISEKEVVADELSKLKKNRKIYIQQRNSNIFFLTDRVQIISSCKNELDNMKKQLQDL